MVEWVIVLVVILAIPVLFGWLSMHLAATKGRDTGERRSDGSCSGSSSRLWV